MVWPHPHGTHLRTQTPTAGSASASGKKKVPPPAQPRKKSADTPPTPTAQSTAPLTPGSTPKVRPHWLICTLGGTHAKPIYPRRDTFGVVSGSLFPTDLFELNATPFCRVSHSGTKTLLQCATLQVPPPVVKRTPKTSETGPTTPVSTTKKGMSRLRLSGMTSSHPGAVKNENAIEGHTQLACMLFFLAVPPTVTPKKKAPPPIATKKRPSGDSSVATPETGDGPKRSGSVKDKLKMFSQGGKPPMYVGSHCCRCVL